MWEQIFEDFLRICEIFGVFGLYMGQDRSVQKERIMKANTDSVARSHQENHSAEAPCHCRCVRRAGAPRCPACLRRPLGVVVVDGNGLASEGACRSLKKQARCWAWHFLESASLQASATLALGPDVLVMPVSLPEACGLEWVRRLKATIF